MSHSHCASGLSRRIVVLGCGTGQATVLRALRILARETHTTLRVGAIVGVTDNGGHSGILRREMGIPAVGDTRACLAAAAQTLFLETLLEYRFPRGRKKGICVGNLLLAAETLRRGSLDEAAREFWRSLPILQGDVSPDDLCHISVIPVSDEAGDICAELEDGSIVRGEWQIIRRRPRRQIVRLFHRPPLSANPSAIRLLQEAELIVIAPGSLRTGIISVLLTRGIREVIERSRSPLFYIANIMTQPGQTDGFSLADHIQELAKYSGRPPTTVIVNTGRPPRELVQNYRASGAEMVAWQGLSNVAGGRISTSMRDGHRTSKIGTISLSAKSIRVPGGVGDVHVYRADLVHRPRRCEVTRLGRAHTTRMRAGPHLIRHDPRKLARVLGAILAGCFPTSYDVSY